MFQQLLEKHKQFHLLADSIYVMAHAGNPATEDELQRYYTISDELFAGLEQIQALLNADEIKTAD